MATFAHEHALHGFKMINKMEMSKDGGLQDHKKFDNKNSIEYKTMRLLLYIMKGWYGSTENDKKLEKAFNFNYENNKKNISE